MTNLLVDSVAVEMEESILGSILFDPEMINEAQLPVAAFSISSHRTIYNSMIELVGQGLKPDLLTVAHTLQKSKKLKEIGGKSKLVQLLDRIVHTVNTKQYAEMLTKDYEHRSVINGLKKIGELGDTDDIDTALAQAKEIIINFEQSKKPTSKASHAKCIVKSDQYFGTTMEILDEIFALENPAEQHWHLIHLAREMKVGVRDLIKMYKDNQQGFKKFKPVTAKEFLASGTDEREWIIGGMISKATTLVMFADGGVGKTLLGYDLCKAIATGSNWNGYPTEQGKVLIIQTDEPEIDTRERLNIAQFGESCGDNVLVETDWQFSQMRHLKDWIATERPAFVMIDSFTSANRSCDDNEKDAVYASTLYDLRDIANEYGCSIMVLHHENKNGGARGTTAIRNNVSEVWRLSKPESKDALTPLHRILEIEKSRSGVPGTFKILLDVENYSWEHQGDLGAPAGTPVALSGRVLAYLNSHPEVRFEPEELVHEFSGSSKDAIRKVLERHRKKGLIKSEERIKQREAGAVRYKVYYYPGKLSSEDLDTPQNHAGHSESSLDNFDSSLDKSQKRVQRVQRAKPMPSSDSVSLDNSSQVDGNIFYPDLPPIGSTVKVSCPGSKYDGMEAKLTEISPDDDSVYCNIRIEEGQYQGHELNFRPEFIVW